MENKPLAYDSLKAVLQHMGPEKRFELTRRIPEIRYAEAAVPLKINFLNLGMNYTKVNGTTYKMSTYHEYEDEVELPKYIQEQNRIGGLTVGYDKFGFQLPRNVLTEGDIDFRAGRILPDEEKFNANLVNDLELMGEMMNEEVRRRENRVERPEEVNRQVEDLFTRYDDFVATSNPEIVARNLLRVARRYINDSTEEVRDAVEKIKSLIDPYIFERNNELPPWRNVIRLTITSKYGEKKIHRVPYNCNFYAAMKILNKMLICRGKLVVNVNTLENPNSYYILRMPADVNLKLKINNLNGDATNSFFNSLSPIIHESSHPLNRVYVNCISDSVNNILDHPLIKNAKLLEVTAVLLDREERLPLILKMKNQTVFVDAFELFDTNEIVELVRSLKMSFRPIGHKIRINVNTRKNGFATLKRIANEFNGTRIRDRKITTPMNHMSNLQVAYTRGKPGNAFNWYLEMVVLST